MKKTLCILLFFISGIAFAQNLEEAIYTATEAFIADQNTSTYVILKKKEDAFKSQIKTKDEQLAFVFLLCNKGYYLRSKNPTEAISSYEDAWSRYSKHELSKLSDYNIIENCLKPLGNLYTKSGDYTNAENIIKQYIFLAEKSKNTNQQIAGAINLCKLYQTVGKHETVLKLTSKYINNPNISKAQKQKLTNINIDAQIALKLITNSAEIPTPIDIKSRHISDLERKYKIEYQNKNFSKALSHLKKITPVLTKTEKLESRILAKHYTSLAGLHLKLNQNRAASLYLHNATKTLLPNFKGNGLPSKEDLYAENTFIDIFDLLAVLQPNTEQALESYNLSTYVADLLYNNLTSQKSKIENLASSRLRSEKCIELLFLEYSKTKSSKYLAEALNYAENSKAQILKEIFKQKSLLEQFPKDVLLIEQQQLLQEQERITNLLINEQLGNSKASNINALSNQLNAISIELKTLKKDILKKHPETENTSINIEILQQKLATDNASLIEYFYGKHAIYQFIISANSKTFNKIDLSETIKNEIVTFNSLFENASIINNNISDYTKRAFSMYNLLNIDDVLSAKNVIIIPDGLLNFVPFEALLTSSTETTNYSKMPFVLLKQTILYNTNISFYLNKPKDYKKPNVLGVFPVFDGTNQKLTYSVDEAKNIENEITSTILLHKEASKSNFIKNASNYNILHLSTHATAGSFTNPASISFYDKNMTLNELYSLNLNTDLVVLSACETGVGKLYKSEGAMSIARGFQYSGAKNVLFSLWQINDLSTSQIMQSFYKNYNKHQSAYKANHNSKVEYLQNENISNIKKSPYYWSAFSYYGEFVRPKENKNIFLYFIIGVVALILILFLINKIKKQV